MLGSRGRGGGLGQAGLELGRQLGRQVDAHLLVLERDDLVGNEGVDAVIRAQRQATGRGGGALGTSATAGKT
eukprot:3861898-Pleurochrysis_carterae.AAC.3